MSQKDSLFRLKNFFRMDKSSSGNHRDRTDADLLRELDMVLPPHVAIAQRCKTIKDLCESDKLTRLEDATIIKLWELTKDLLVPSRPIEQRHIIYRFYQKLVQCQYEELSVIREHFFRKCFTEAADVPEDIQSQIDLLKILTDSGKNIKSVDDVIGDFILRRWLATINNTQQIKEILEIIQNIIVYNAAYLNPNIVDGIIVYACNKCYPPDDVVPQCLDVLDAVLCYTILPQKMLLPWIGALCRTVNQENHVQKSWDIMKKLLGTKMGHAALLTMCNILDNSNYIYDDTLLRGAVFYINMGLWGSTSSKVMLFKLSPTSVLQSYLTVLKSQRVIVTYEVIIGIQRLIEVSGRELTEPTWDVLCEVLKTIADNISFYESANELPREHVIQKAYHETLDKIENLIQQNEAATDLNTIYSVIEYVCDNRSEESVIRLMEFKASKISPTQSHWLQELNAFMYRFYHMKNFTIRNTSLQILNRIMEMNKSAYEEEILESIVIPTFANISQDTEPRIRTNVVKLLLNFVAHCETKRTIELLDIIEKVTNRPFDRYAEDNWIVLRSEDELSHIVTVVDELIRIFLIKLYALPTSHAIKIYTILKAHIEKYYQKPVLLDTSVPVRNRIFTWILKLRANANYHIGYPDDSRGGRLRFSHFLAIDTNEMTFHQPLRQSQSQSNALQQQITLDSSDIQPNISVKRCCKIIIDCLTIENNWAVMQLVMKGLPSILQNKAFFRGVEMELLASSIIGLATKVQQQLPGSKSRMDSFAPSKPQSSDFQALIMNTLAALIPYHPNMSPKTQGRIINSLRPGLLSLDTTPRVCVQAFTIMLMETMDSILRHLPEILLDMSRMMTTLNVAVPVLEFLSTLSRLPSRLFTNFTQTQYMYVFAISLPYTNPHKYDHYTVSLAHHVIAGWFLKCRLSLRKDFVKYILKGFTTNVQKPFEEIKKVDATVNDQNQDSSNRKRSSSLTERGAKQRERPSFHQLHYKSNEQADAVAYDFHMELADTCIDFLSRHTYSTCSALPKRSPTAEYLLGNNGQAMSWLVGNNVITVTTSCCSLTAVRGGLCDRCALVCKPDQKTDQSSSNGITSPEVCSVKSSRSEICQRYTKESLQQVHSGQDSESSELLSSNSSTVVTPLAVNADQSRFHSKPQSNDGRFSTSSGSLDALSRRGSNPDTFNHSSETGSKQSSMSQPMYLSPQQSIDRIKQVCICSCSGWAEIVIRRPTGNMSWIMRIQNHIALESMSCDVPLQDLIHMCSPSLGEIYNIQDLLNEETAWNTNANDPSPMIPEQTKKKVTSIDISEPPKLAMKTDEESNNTQLIGGSIIQRSPENVTTIAVKEIPLSMSNTPQLSGPINIPKVANKDKIPSGSFSDVEPEEDDEDDGNGDNAFDENDSRSRNPVRRVNSSPEMSSNWRHPFINPKGNPPAIGNNNTLSVHGVTDDDFNILDSEQQQKKKNYGKVSCEAIPEEIADSTPPKPIQNDMNSKTMIKPDNNLTVASGEAKNQQNDFIAKSTQASSSNAKGTDSSVLPRKQHSADDADQSQSNQQQPPINEPRHSSSGSAINLGGSSSNSKKLSIDMQPNLMKKPPQPQAPLSPRLLRNYEMSFLNNSINFNDFSRGRSKTISVVRSEHNNRDNSKWTFQGTRSAISPSSIFLQLFHTGPNRVTEQPILIGAKNARSLNIINLTPPYEIHKIAVLYVGRGQAHSEIDILSNCYGSSRYMEFIQNLGSLVALKNARELNLFIDMETDGRVGNFTYVWQDDIIQVMFHVATLMPNNERDPNRTEKKKHIGNDFVTIVYNESGEEYNLNTIKGQFNYACVVVEPLELNSNRIFVRGKEDVAKFICNTEPKIISDTSAPGYARQLALHANLASLVAKSLQTKNARPYASNWLERLRQIKKLRAKILKENESTTDSSQTLNSSANYEKETEDFTKYT